MDSKLLEKFYKGECSAQEVKEVLQWFKNNNLPDYERLWEEAENEGTAEFKATDVLQQLKTAISYPGQELTQIPANPENLPEPKVVQMKSNTWQVLSKVAAVLLLPLCFLVFFAKDKISRKNITYQLVLVQTGSGEKKTIRLADGSVVTLNSRSKIWFHRPFRPNTREINLAGEAFFKVAPDSLRPFIVKSGIITTQALGTSFNINHRAPQNETVVALVTGSVKVNQQKNDKGYYLTKLHPGEHLVYQYNNNRFRVSAFNTKDILGWQQDILYFKKASLNQVITKLENWYGVHIKLAGNIPENATNWHYTGEYKNQSLANVLSGIGFVKDFAFRIDKNKVLINFK